MQVKQQAEARKTKRTGLAGQVDAARVEAERLVRRTQKEVRVVVNMNEHMSCSRLRSFIGS